MLTLSSTLSSFFSKSSLHPGAVEDDCMHMTHEPTNPSSVHKSKTVHEQQVDLLRLIAESLQPLREIAVAHRESIELQQQVATSLRKLAFTGLGEASTFSFSSIPQEEINRPSACSVENASLPKAEQSLHTQSSGTHKVAETAVTSMKKADASVHREAEPAASEVSPVPGQGQEDIGEVPPTVPKEQKAGLNVPTKSTLHEHPVYRDVHCRFNVFNIEEINIKKQSIKAEFYFEAAWEMPELLCEIDGYEALVSDGDVDWVNVFQPKIIFTNKIGELQVQSWNAADPGNWQKFGRPMASWRAKISGEFYQDLDLRRFPYDKQSVSIGLSTDHLSTVCNLIPNEIVKSAAQVRSFSIRDQFTLRFDADNSVQASPPRKGAGGEYSQVKIIIVAHRNPVFFLSNVMVLMFLLVIVYFLAILPIPPWNVSERMEIAANIVLTAVALKLLSAERLPDLPYLTLLDQYLLGSIGLIVLMIGEVFIAYKFVPQGFVEDLDAILLCIIAALWVLGHIPVFQPLWRAAIIRCMRLVA